MSVDFKCNILDITLKTYNGNQQVNSFQGTGNETENTDHHYNKIILPPAKKKKDNFRVCNRSFSSG